MNSNVNENVYQQKGHNGNGTMCTTTNARNVSISFAIRIMAHQYKVIHKVMARTASYRRIIVTMAE